MDMPGDKDCSATQDVSCGSSIGKDSGIEQSINESSDAEEHLVGVLLTAAEERGEGGRGDEDGTTSFEMVVKRIKEQLIVELQERNSTSREDLHQLLQYFKNRLTG